MFLKLLKTKSFQTILLKGENMKTKVFLAAVLIVSVTINLYAGSEAVQIKEVSLFKNGLGYFVCEVIPPAGQTSFVIMPPAAATHGTFWLSYPEKVKVQSFAAKQEECQQTSQANSIPEILKANIGKKVRLVLGNDKEVEGIITYFAQGPINSPPDPYAVGSATTDIDARRNYRGGYEQTNLMIVEKEGGQLCVNPHSIKSVEFIGSTAEKNYTEKTKCYKLDIKLEKAADGQKLLLSQLSKGITWAPSYIVDISDAEKAAISAKAEIINEACDLNDVTVYLVTGYPHLQFSDIISPLSLKENLAQFLMSLSKGESERGDIRGLRSNIMSQSIAYAREARSGETMPAYGTAAEGTAAEDLFFYPLKKIHLSKSQVGGFPLFTESVPYKHIYKWDIPDYTSEDEYYRRRQRGEEREKEEKEEEVWHCIKLENKGKTPWTTAPAQTVKDGFILGQDTLNYTPTEGKSTLRITRAVNVKAEQAELETERKREAARFYGDPYDLVTVEGKLAVTNMQPKDISLEITKNLSGELKSSQPQATIEKLAKGLKAMNASLKLTWTLDLKPAERKELNYTYEVYVRR